MHKASDQDMHNLRYNSQLRKKNDNLCTNSREISAFNEKAVQQKEGEKIFSDYITISTDNDNNTRTNRLPKLMEKVPLRKK